MDKLEHNLTSGTSYLTQNSKNPKRDGQIIYANLVAVATRLFGAEYTEEEMELVIDRLSDGTFDGYTKNMSVEKAARAIDAKTKRSGGRGWL